MSTNYFANLDIGGIRNSLVILDIDGTIACDRQTAVGPKILQKINELKKQNQVVLFSNHRKNERNLKVSQNTGLTLVDSDKKKPSKEILKDIENKNNLDMVVIGDKFLTDELFAHKIKAEFIKVKRLTSNNDRLIIKISYLLDDLCSLFKNLVKRLA